MGPTEGAVGELLLRGAASTRRDDVIDLLGRSTAELEERAGRGVVRHLLVRLDGLAVEIDRVLVEVLRHLDAVVVELHGVVADLARGRNRGVGRLGGVLGELGPPIGGTDDEREKEKQADDLHVWSWVVVLRTDESIIF